MPSFAIWVTIPSSPSLVLRDLELGLLYVIAFSVVSIVGLIMAGWGSANKYGVLGGLRSVAQLISYEIPIIAVALTVALLAGSLNLVEIVEKQSPVPFAVLQPLGLFLFLMAGLAEVGRTPFDIYHAESEIMGRAVRGVQRGALGHLLPGGVHQHVPAWRPSSSCCSWAAGPGRCCRRSSGSC